jgi:small-conductance mechanosensitive channel
LTDQVEGPLSYQSSPSKLLQDTIAASSFLATIAASALLAFDLPLIGVVASSSVLIAVLGFALRNVFADIVAGMALGLNGPTGSATGW